MHIQVFARLGKHISSVFLEPGDFATAKLMESLFPVRRWNSSSPEFAPKMAGPHDAVVQRSIMLIEWDKRLTLVRDAKSLQSSMIYLTHSLPNHLSHGFHQDSAGCSCQPGW